jgi:hypothetical protein
MEGECPLRTDKSVAPGDGVDGRQVAMNDSGNIDATPRRSWLQFRLGSLILFMVLCALGVTWWRQWKQSVKLAELKQELVWAKSELEMLGAIRDVSRAVDFRNPEDVQVLKALQHHGWLFSTVQRRYLASPDDGTEIILFQYEPVSVPGQDSSLAVLIRDGKIVDSIARETSTREETHEAKLEDIDGDGTLDLVLHCSPEFWSGDRKPFTLSYAISGAGFGPEKKIMEGSPRNQQQPE